MSEQEIKREAYKKAAELLTQINKELGPIECWAYSYLSHHTNGIVRLHHDVCIGHPAWFFIRNAELPGEEVEFVSAIRITPEEFKDQFDQIHGQIMPGKDNWT